MNYLFFDIECATCANGGRLCEFGYVLTDGKLNIMATENLLIDPACEFDKYVLSKMLNYPERKYRKSPALPNLYSKIVSLLTAPNTLVIGHTTLGDCEHIGDDCIRYGLRVPSFDYADVAELYRSYTSSKNTLRLTKMCEELNVEVVGKAHSADVDALMTMLVYKALCAADDCKPSELAVRYKSCMGRFCDYEKHYRMKKAVDEYKTECDRNGTRTTDSQRRNIVTFIKGVKPQKKIPRNYLNGKKICIIDNYWLAHYTELINLVQLVAAVGGELVTAPNKCDIFVDCDIRTASGESLYSKSKEKIERAARAGKKTEIIDLNELLRLLNVDECRLRKPFKIDFAAMARAETHMAYNETDGATASLGEILKSKIIRTE